MKETTATWSWICIRFLTIWLSVDAILESILFIWNFIHFKQNLMFGSRESAAFVTQTIVTTDVNRSIGFSNVWLILLQQDWIFAFVVAWNDWYESVWYPLPWEMWKIIKRNSIAKLYLLSGNWLTDCVRGNFKLEFFPSKTSFNSNANV